MGSRCARAALVVGFLLMPGCGPPDLDVPGAPPPVEVLTDPPADFGRASPAARLRVLPTVGVDLGELLLFEGEVGDYHERRIRRGDLPQTLMERGVPVVVYEDTAAGELVVAPKRTLDGGVHSLVSTARGVLWVFEVERLEGDPAVAERVWPPPGGATAGRHVVYCGAELESRLGEGVLLWPGPARGQVTRVALDESGRGCVWLDVLDALAEGAELVAPLELGGVLLEPGPFRIGVPEPPLPTPCVAPETPLGPGCARVIDDRILLRPPNEPTLWWVTVADAPSRGTTVQASRDGAMLVLRGLQPSHEHRLGVVAASPRGEVAEVAARIVTPAARDHVVIDEVLANPAGAEPQQEWVELVNDGTRSVTLAGWRLEDTAGGVELPSFTLLPFERALVVRDDFELPTEPDVPVAETVPLLRVPSIGANGLSNAGESLRLLDPLGRVASTFPAFVAKVAGESICRLAPWVADELWAFGPHAAPGASPGSISQLAEP